MNKQWLITLDYRIDTSTKISIPTNIFIGIKDNVINSRSLSKLDSIHRDLTVKRYEGKHIFNYKDSVEYKQIKTDIIKLLT